MKKIILTSAIIFASLAGVFAQTDDVTLNVILKPIQTLVVNPASKTVNLVYDSKEKYKDGVSKTETDHLSIYSIGGFQVSVSSASPTTLKKGAETIESDGILITAVAGTGNISTGYTMPSNVPLATTGAPIISHDKGGVDKNFTITYTDKGGDNYIDKYFKADGAASTYNTTVVYTIAAN